MKILSNVVVVPAMIYPASLGRAADDEPTNLFPNGTFDAFDGDLPNGWTAEIWNEPIMRVKLHRLRPGRDGTGSCLEIEAGTPMTITTLTSPALAVSADRPYLFKGYYASTCQGLTTNKRWLDAEGVTLKGNWLDAEGQPVGSFTIVLPDTQDRWIEFFREARAGGGRAVAGRHHPPVGGRPIAL